MKAERRKVQKSEQGREQFLSTRFETSSGYFQGQLLDSHMDNLGLISSRSKGKKQNKDKAANNTLKANRHMVRKFISTDDYQGNENENDEVVSHTDENGLVQSPEINSTGWDAVKKDTPNSLSVGLSAGSASLENITGLLKTLEMLTPLEPSNSTPSQ